jgi:hypothetical protein
LRVERRGSDPESVDQEPGLVIFGRGRVQIPIRGDQVPTNFLKAEVH